MGNQALNIIGGIINFLGAAAYLGTIIYFYQQSGFYSGSISEIPVFLTGMALAATSVFIAPNWIALVHSCHEFKPQRTIIIHYVATAWSLLLFIPACIVSAKGVEFWRFCAGIFMLGHPEP